MLHAFKKNEALRQAQHMLSIHSVYLNRNPYIYSKPKVIRLQT